MDIDEQKQFALPNLKKSILAVMPNMRNM